MKKSEKIKRELQEIRLFTSISAFRRMWEKIPLLYGPPPPQIAGPERTKDTSLVSGSVRL